MISMHPIKEQLVLESLDAFRFGDDTNGYVVVEGEKYHGHILFTVNDSLTTVQECALSSNALVDGAVRACVAYGDTSGATHFTVNESDEKLAQWKNVFLKHDDLPVDNKKLLYTCKNDA